MKKTPCFASFSYWGVHWLKLAPELKKVPGGKTTTHNILFEPILPNFEEIFEIGHDDFGGCPTLPVRKTALPFYSPPPCTFALHYLPTPASLFCKLQSAELQQ